ncbi:MAG TPA: RND transporter [Desulfobulbus sp.]|nr:RND transporter [Desulfobulbus sp.]
MFIRHLARLALDRPGPVMVLVLAWALLTGALAVRLRVDTAPGDMLPADEVTRRFTEQAKKEFNLHDTLVLGVVNDRNENGVFNPATLHKILVLSRFAATLRDPKRPERRVITSDIVAPDTVDLIGQAGLGKVRFSWLMKKAPADDRQALAIRDRALSDPMLRGTLISEDGRAMIISIPVSSMDFARRAGLALRAKIREIGAGSERFYITGQPLAEETFASDMLLQFAALAPLALLSISLFLYLVFGKIRLIVPPLIITTVTVTSTMGLLIGSGNALQGVNAMIPVFLLPVALAASTRILSAFRDSYRHTGDRRRSLEQVTENLRRSLPQAALPPAAAFASLALVPAPPVRIFGIFVSLGILLAWLLTLVVTPAVLMLMQEKQLKDTGSRALLDPAADSSLSNRILRRLGPVVSSRPWPVLGCTLAVAAMALIGILLIQVNDNPVRRFKKNHPIRKGDRILNTRFAGTWQASLVLRGEGPAMSPRQAADWLSGKLDDRLVDVPVIRQKVLAEISEAAAESEDPAAMARRLERSWSGEIKRLSPDDALGFDRWSTALDSLDRLLNQEEVFKRPDVLNYIAGLQRHLESLDMVGKSGSLVDLVKKAHQELLEGDPRYFTIPATVNGVAQALDTYRHSNRPDFLRHLVTRDYHRANIQVWLRSGNSRDMAQLIRDTDNYLAATPPPISIRHSWAGPTVLHAAWQEKMTTGMLASLLLGSATIFLTASLLFRSAALGAMTLVPVAGSIGTTSAMIGYLGDDFDVAVALLTLLPMGLAVDVATHFLQETRATMQRLGDWRQTVEAMFREPARILSRTLIVIAAAALPLLFAPLLPFRNAGIMLTATLLGSGLATLCTLPAMLSLLQKRLFRDLATREGGTAEKEESA